jgi:hypothetical protein
MRLEPSTAAWLRNAGRAAPAAPAPIEAPSIATTGTTSSTFKAPAAAEPVSGRQALLLDEQSYVRARERLTGTVNRRNSILGM